MAYANRWICPHCEHAAVLTPRESIKVGHVSSQLDSADGDLAVVAEFIACPNPSCKKTTLKIWYGSGAPDHLDRIIWSKTRPRKGIRLFPPSYARLIPDFVPEAIRQDYEEACAIADLSPKSAAALARRALQGIVRDFHGIVRGTLNQELEALKPKIDTLIWDAIDAVRSVGNIGAHMEKNINIIVDVEPDEAVKLIRLVELLIAEWYVAKHNRQQALADIITLAGEKKKQRQRDGSDTGDTTADAPVAQPPSTA